MANMKIEVALKKVDETMQLCARHYADVGVKVYSADKHTNAAGLALKKVLAPAALADGTPADAVELTSANLAMLFHALYNHSAWRQKFEKAGLFEKKSERTVGDAIAELEEEVG